MSTQAEGTALSALEREAEHTRADLIHTVDELHSRVSPQAIKEEVKAYARETGSDLIQRLERRALDNPLQMIAIAAGLAYPAWRLLINIPAPFSWLEPDWRAANLAVHPPPAAQWEHMEKASSSPKV